MRIVPTHCAWERIDQEAAKYRELKGLDLSKLFAILQSSNTKVMGTRSHTGHGFIPHVWWAPHLAGTHQPRCPTSELEEGGDRVGEEEG